MLLGIDNCLSDVEGDLQQAAIELNFIHNLPIAGDMPKQKEEYFYKVEFLDYIEQTKDIFRIKNVINVLSEINK